MSKKTKADLLNDPDFKDLVGRKNTISWILTVLELVLYFGFISLIAFKHDFLASKLFADAKTTVGIPIAVGTILGSWVLTGIYIFWANNKYDKMVKDLKDKIGG
jgi:uncharacterized membrane protein (DUF485 family)